MESPFSTVTDTVPTQDTATVSVLTESSSQSHTHNILPLRYDLGNNRRRICTWGHLLCFGGGLSLSAFLAAMSQVVYLYPTCDTPSCWNIKSVLARSLNYSTSPCNNFYHFVCDGWKANSPKHELVFSEVQTRVARSAMDTLLRIRHVPARQQTAVQKAAAMFRTCIDILRTGEDHRPSIKNFLRTLGLLDINRSAVDVLDLVVDLALNWNVPVLFEVSIDSDLRDVYKFTLHMKRNRYLMEWVHRRKFMNGGTLYKYMESLSDIIGRNVSLESLILLEHNVVIMLGAVTDTVRSANSVKVSDLEQYTPGIHWEEWTTAFNHHLPESGQVLGSDVIRITDQDYFRGVAAIILDDRRRRHDLINFVVWFVVQFLAPFVSLQLMYTSFNSRARARNFVTNVCYREVNQILPYAFGAPFVVQSVPLEVRKDVRRMVQQVKEALEVSFQESRWMDNATRDTAIHKLHSMHVFVAYPDNILSSLDEMYSIVPDAGPVFLESRLKSWYVIMQNEKEKLWKRQPESEILAGYRLTDVNAYYWPQSNSMIIPAGIINPPFYMPREPDSVNFGGLGHIVAHEIVHGFDVESSFRDATGERRDWWSKTTRLQYKKRVTCLKDMYDSLLFPLHRKSHAVSENIADSVGLAQAYKAYESVAGDDAKGGIMGFTAEQAFYITSCFKWCSNRDKPGPGYSPEELRCNVPLQNIPNFAKAFGCRRNDPMNPSHKCNFW
ncbi:neprilysin-1-like [Ornithodoros turicata]|uniref:neprilysin-1-like n=1 Tax=Ornithodoros turicata TaxID=34597 RepID=UPI003139DCC2